MGIRPDSAAGRLILKHLGEKPPGRSKYRNERCMVNGRKFHSRKEAARYVVLCDEQARGIISGLRCQVGFKVKAANGFVIETYRADFVYVRDGKRCVEDCKGFRTADYRRKKRWMLGVHGIEVIET